MDYEKLKEVIAKQIKENGRGEITGPVLQAVLMAMVDSLGEVYPQTYTDEQKAQARANIDALSNYDGEITKEKLSAEVQAILDDVTNKQDITDESLATIAKTIVGAINEVYKGGLEDASISTSKIEDGAVTNAKIANKAVDADKIADYSIRMDKLTMTGRQVPDLGLSVYHDLDITLTGEGKTGSATLKSNGQTYTELNNILYYIDNIIRTLGSGVTLIVEEPVAGSSFGKEYLGTIVGCSMVGNGEISAIVKDYSLNKDYFVVIKNYEFTTKICLTDQLPKIASLETDVTSLLGKVGMNVKVLPKGTNLLSANLENGIWLVTEPNNYTNPPSWFSGNGIALLVVDKTSNNVILIGHDGSSNELPAWASRYLSSTSGWRGAGKGLEDIFAKKSEIPAKDVKFLPKGTDLNDDTAIEEGILYMLYADYYGNPHPIYTNLPEKMSNSSPALLFRVADKVCIIGADSKSSFPFYAWRNVGELKMWAYTSLADKLGYKLEVSSYLSDTEINNIWDNN